MPPQNQSPTPPPNQTPPQTQQGQPLTADIPPPTQQPYATTSEIPQNNSNKLAILGLVLAFLAPIFGLIVSIIALIKKPRGAGVGLPVAGIITSIILIPVSLFLLILIIGGLQRNQQQLENKAASSLNSATGNQAAPGKQFSTKCYSFDAPNSDATNTSDFTGHTYYSKNYTMSEKSQPDNCGLIIAPVSAEASDQASIAIQPSNMAKSITGIIDNMQKRLESGGYNYEQANYFTTNNGYSAASIRYKSGSDDANTAYVVMDNNPHIKISGTLVYAYTINSYTGADKTTTPGRVQALRQIAETIRLY